MNVLVVGKGTDDPINVCEHILTFVDTPRSNELIPNLSDFDLALFHVSEDCTEDDGKFARVLDSWFAAKTISKVIAISGGYLDEQKKVRLQQLGNVPFIPKIETAYNLMRLRWNVVPVSTDMNLSTIEIAQRLSQEPELLNALHILLQGVLAVWAQDPGNQLGWVANDLLGVGVIPTMPTCKFLNREVLWRALGLDVWKNMIVLQSKLCSGIIKELGIKSLDDNSPIKKLIDHICDIQDDDKFDQHIVFAGFNAIDNFLWNS